MDTAQRRGRRWPARAGSRGRHRSRDCRNPHAPGRQLALHGRSGKAGGGPLQRDVRCALPCLDGVHQGGPVAGRADRALAPAEDCRRSGCRSGLRLAGRASACRSHRQPAHRGGGVHQHVCAALRLAGAASLPAPGAGPAGRGLSHHRRRLAQGAAVDASLPAAVALDRLAGLCVRGTGCPLAPARTARAPGGRHPQRHRHPPLHGPVDATGEA